MSGFRTCYVMCYTTLQLLHLTAKSPSKQAQDMYHQWEGGWRWELKLLPTGSPSDTTFRPSLYFLCLPGLTYSTSLPSWSLNYGLVFVIDSQWQTQKSTNVPSTRPLCTPPLRTPKIWTLIQDPAHLNEVLALSWVLSRSTCKTIVYQAVFTGFYFKLLTTLHLLQYPVIIITGYCSKKIGLCLFKSCLHPVMWK